MRFSAGQFIGFQNRHRFFNTRQRFGIFQHGFVAVVANRPDNRSFHTAGRMRLVADRFNPLNHIFNLLFRRVTFHDNNHRFPLQEKKAMAFAAMAF
ncbi:MAG TPA: hypothetical protein DHO02_05405 [Syntrophaceae bacterium]|nr:hypothetical protein [Syntrophaceae bacterium]